MKIFARIYFPFLCMSLLLLSPAIAQPTTAPSPSPAQTTPPPAPTVSAKDLTASGAQLYKAGKLDQAAKKFAAALKLEPNNDETLAYAAITAYQIGNQSQAREYFQRRAEIPNQKPSVSLFCRYMESLTRWRQAHELIAASGEIVDDLTTYKIADKNLLQANDHITKGIISINQALEIKADYAEALNVKNLLHTEAALIAKDEAEANEHREKSYQALKQALKLHKGGTEDFGAPTLLIGEYATTDELQTALKDINLSKLEGGRPISRAVAVLPVIKIAPAKPKTESPDAVGGGAVSLGPGQGALRPSKPEILQIKGGIAKVEILVSPSGKVVFARVLSGPAATTRPAVTAAKKWLFAPPKFEGQPVQVSAVISFNVKSNSASAKKATTAKTTPPANKPAQ